MVLGRHFMTGFIVALLLNLSDCFNSLHTFQKNNFSTDVLEWWKNYNLPDLSQLENSQSSFSWNRLFLTVTDPTSLLYVLNNNLSTNYSYINSDVFLSDGYLNVIKINQTLLNKSFSDIKSIHPNDNKNSAISKIYDISDLSDNLSTVETVMMLPTGDLINNLSTTYLNQTNLSTSFNQSNETGLKTYLTSVKNIPVLKNSTTTTNTTTTNTTTTTTTTTITTTITTNTTISTIITTALTCNDYLSSVTPKNYTPVSDFNIKGPFDSSKFQTEILTTDQFSGNTGTVTSMSTSNNRNETTNMQELTCIDKGNSMNSVHQKPAKLGTNEFNRGIIVIVQADEEKTNGFQENQFILRNDMLKPTSYSTESLVGNDKNSVRSIDNENFANFIVIIQEIYAILNQRKLQFTPQDYKKSVISFNNNFTFPSDTISNINEFNPNSKSKTSLQNQTMQLGSLYTIGQFSEPIKNLSNLFETQSTLLSNVNKNESAHYTETKELSSNNASDFNQHTTPIRRIIDKQETNVISDTHTGIPNYHEPELTKTTYTQQPVETNFSTSNFHPSTKTPSVTMNKQNVEVFLTHNKENLISYNLELMKNVTQTTSVIFNKTDNNLGNYPTTQLMTELYHRETSPVTLNQFLINNISNDKSNTIIPTTSSYYDKDKLYPMRYEESNITSEITINYNNHPTKAFNLVKENEKGYILIEDYFNNNSTTQKAMVNIDFISKNDRLNETLFNDTTKDTDTNPKLYIMSLINASSKDFDKLSSTVANSANQYHSIGLSRNGSTTVSDYIFKTAFKNNDSVNGSRIVNMNGKYVYDHQTTIPYIDLPVVGKNVSSMFSNKNNNNQYLTVNKEDTRSKVTHHNITKTFFVKLPLLTQYLSKKDTNFTNHNFYQEDSKLNDRLP